jgi:hypothetical protein
MAEQRTLNPQVLGSNPRGRTSPSRFPFWSAKRTTDTNCAKAQDRRDGAARPPTGPLVGSGSVSVETRAGHPRTARDRDEWAVTADQLLGQGRNCGALLRHRLPKASGLPKIAERRVDHPVGLCSAGAEGLEVGEAASQPLGAARLGGHRRRIRAIVRYTERLPRRGSRGEGLIFEQKVFVECPEGHVRVRYGYFQHPQIGARLEPYVG